LRKVVAKYANGEERFKPRKRNIRISFEVNRELIADDGFGGGDVGD
jgi:hypothetical protein